MLVPWRTRRRRADRLLLLALGSLGSMLCSFVPRCHDTTCQRPRHVVSSSGRRDATRIGQHDGNDDSTQSQGRRVIRIGRHGARRKRAPARLGTERGAPKAGWTRGEAVAPHQPGRVALPRRAAGSQTPARETRTYSSVLISSLLFHLCRSKSYTSWVTTISYRSYNSY